MAVGALSSGCIELPNRPFSCELDGDCAQVGGGGAPYVCRHKECVAPGPDEGPDGGPGGGDDGGSEDAGTDGGPIPCLHDPALMPCTPDGGWCWDNPFASGSRLLAIRGRSENDILAVGANGVVLSWNGACWARSRTGKQDQTLNGIWSAPGREWQVVGLNGTLLKSDGGAWLEDRISAATVQDVSGGPDGTAYAVGFSGSIHRFLDGGWSPQSSGTTHVLSAVWTVSRDEAWAFSEDGEAFHGVAGVWSRDVTAPVLAYAGAAGLPGGGLLAVGPGSLVRREGVMWTQTPIGTSGTRLNDVWHDSGLTWMVGEPGSIYLGDGGTEQSGTSQLLHSVWSRGERAWAVGESGVIVQRTGSQWAEAPGGVVRSINALWSASDGPWAVGDDGLIMRRAGTLWRTVAPPENNNFRDIWGTGNLLLVLGDGGKVYVFRDGVWKSTESVGENLNALWGLGADQVWGVGPGGSVRRRNTDGSWASEPLTGGSGGALSLNAIWGSSPTNLWAVGSGGTVYRRDPACTLATCNWISQTVTPATTSEFTGVWGTSTGKVWVSASSGAIYHFNGTAWSAQSITGGNPGLLAITGRSESELWAVGRNGSVATGDGNNWNLQIVTVGHALNSVVVAGDTVWAGGLDGTIIKHQ